MRNPPAPPGISEPKSESDADRLRGALFETIKLLKEKKISAEDARAMAEVGQTIVNSAKVELEFAKVAGKGLPSNYIPKAAQSVLIHEEEKDKN